MNSFRQFRIIILVSALSFVGVIVYQRWEPANKFFYQTTTYDWKHDTNEEKRMNNTTLASRTNDTVQTISTGYSKDELEDDEKLKLLKSEPLPGNDSFLDNVSRDDSTKSTLKTILFWNGWYIWKDYRFGLGREVFMNKCNTDKCETTADTRQLSKADAVVFFAGKLNYNNKPVLPPKSNQQQIYVFLNSEPPSKYVTHLASTNIGGYFNVTISYRHDSTIYWPYGRVIARENDYQPMTMLQVVAKNRTVAWMVSMCKNYNVRRTYCNELKKYIQVDVYGRCGELKCPESSRFSTECVEYLSKNYKFYLAFENSHCVDYITEKVFRTLQYDLVPIVMGGANYTKYLPPNSFINVKDFQSPKHLAEYLIYLDNNPDEYLKYFEWKRHYIVKDDIPNSDRVFCELCEMLRNKKRFLLNYNVADWWEKDTCINDVNELRNIYHVE